MIRSPSSSSSKLSLLLAVAGRTAVARSFSSTAINARLPRLTLYTGTDCQLCDVAKAVLDDACKEVPFDLTLYNIRDDNEQEIHKWRRAYQYDIPVLHLEGQEIARHRLDKAKLLDHLRAAGARVERS